MSHFDHRTNKCELKVQRIIHLQNLANQLPYVFIEVTKLYIPVVNTLTHIDVPEGQLENESKIRLKCGRSWLKRYNLSEEENRNEN